MFWYFYVIIQYILTIYFQQYLFRRYFDFDIKYWILKFHY